MSIVLIISKDSIARKRKTTLIVCSFKVSLLEMFSYFFKIVFVSCIFFYYSYLFPKTFTLFFNWLNTFTIKVYAIRRWLPDFFLAFSSFASLLISSRVDISGSFALFFCFYYSDSDNFLSSCTKKQFWFSSTNILMHWKTTPDIFYSLGNP